MTYQSLILAASGSNTALGNFNKCRFLVNSKINLIDAAILTNQTAAKIVVALDPDEYNFLNSSGLTDRADLVQIRNRTKGALATSGLCLDKLSNETPIVIQSVDGLCFNVISDFVKEMQRDDADGGVIVFPSNDPKYSYVRVAGDKPIEFAEKQLICELATA